jgi:hypothetical protein
VTKKKKFASLFEFFLRHLKVFVACSTVKEDPEVTSPEGVIGLDYKVGGPEPVVDHQRLIVVEVLAVKGDSFHFSAGNFEAG